MSNRSSIDTENFEKKAVLIAAVGSNGANAKKAYDNIEGIVKKANPEIPVYWSYTSHAARKKIKEKGTVIKAVPEVLKDLFTDGFTSIKIIALYMVPAEEYHKLCMEVDAFLLSCCGSLKIEITKPFLDSAVALEKLCDCIISEIPSERKNNEAVILMGHGNKHGICDSNYIAAAVELNSRDKNIFLAVFEGKPDFKHVIETLIEKKIPKVYLMPLMIVSGIHAVNDLAGDNVNSCKAQIEAAGIECVPVLKGIGEYKGIGRLFSDDI